MHFQNKQRTVALAICALLLSLNIMSAYPITAHASTVTHASMYKIIDMSLASTGIVANNGIISALANQIVERVDSTLRNYLVYLEETYGDGSAPNEDTFEEFLTFQTDDVKEFVGWFEDLWVLAIGCTADTFVVTIEEIADYLVGADTETGITKNNKYTIDDKTVEYFRKSFDDYAETEADFYYIDTLSPNEINPGWFPTRESYLAVKNVVSGSPYPIIMNMDGVTNNVVFSVTSANTFVSESGKLHICENGLLLVDYPAPPKIAQYYVYIYDDDWDSCDLIYAESKNWENITYTNYDEYYALCTSKGSGSINYSQLECPVSDSRVSLPILTNDGRKMKVYRNETVMKMYDCGQQSYYLNQSNDYSTTNDNSVTFSGDYYQDNSDSYSYDIVQNEIDNSTEINEETVNNIVNTTTSTIINNYYTDSDSGSGEGTGSGDSSMGSNNDYTDELETIRAEIGGFGGALIDVALHHFDVIEDVATVIRDGAQTATDPINDTLIIIDDTMNNLSATAENLGEDLKGVGGFMSEVYSFIPEEVMSLLIASAVGSIGLKLWHAFRK